MAGAPHAAHRARRDHATRKDSHCLTDASAPVQDSTFGPRVHSQTGDRTDPTEPSTRPPGPKVLYKTAAEAPFLRCKPASPFSAFIPQTPKPGSASPPKREAGGGRHLFALREITLPLPLFSHSDSPLAMAAPRPPPLGALGGVVGGSGGAAPAAGAPAGVSMRMFHGESFLGEMEVFPMKRDGEGGLPFPTNEIRVSHFSPASERCPPLAILQTIAPFSVRCKLQTKLTPPNPGLQRLYLTCFNEFKVCPQFL